MAFRMERVGERVEPLGFGVFAAYCGLIGKHDLAGLRANTDFLVVEE
jgi:hypothetical protein